MVLSYFFGKLLGLNFHLSDPTHMMRGLFSANGYGSPEVSTTSWWYMTCQHGLSCREQTVGTSTVEVPIARRARAEGEPL
jgi:hypothetical protein